MAVTPINFTRISHNLQTYSLIDSLRRNTLSVFQEQNRLASGMRLNAPSEDPALAAKATQLTEMLERQEQVVANLRHADSFLATTDAAIQEVNDLLIQADSIASEMVNSTSDQDMRDAQAELILGIIDQLVQVGNRSYAGRYLFGGHQTTSPPFTQNLGGVEYRGDTRSMAIDAGPSQDLLINLPGSELFGSLSTRVDGWRDFDPALTTETRLSDIDGAADLGISRGQIRVSVSGPAVSFVVDLRQADTMGDVIDMMNDAADQAGLTVGAGSQFNATINAAGDGLDISTNAGTVTVAEVSAGVTARDLGILGGGVATINGTDLNPKVTDTTLIADLFGGAGAALGSIRIRNGTLSRDIDLSGATTVQDILNKINTAGIEAVARINDAGNGIAVTNRASGLTMTIEEAGGTTAEILGIRTYHGQTDLSEFNDGQGVRVNEGENDFRIVAKDGSTYDVNLDGAATIQDVLDLINAATGGAVVASLPNDGNGIQLQDTTGGAGTLEVERLNYSFAIDDLGLTGIKGEGATAVITGDDTNGVKPESVFSALIELYESLVDGGPNADQRITAAGEKLNEFVDQTNRLQGVVGARSRSMTTRLQLTEDAVLSTTKLLSETQDLDYTTAVTKFQQAQTALQANLMTGSRLMQLSLLDFIG